MSEIYPRPTSKKFREINLQYNSLVKSYFDEILAKNRWGKIFKFAHCAHRPKKKISSNQVAST